MGISERKEREREARRGAILDAAESVFKSKGFALATMDDIAREAELAKGTVYLYYKSKEELQVGLVLRAMDLLLSHFEESMASVSTSFEKLRLTGQAYQRFATEHDFYFNLMNVADAPVKSQQISPEMVVALHERSNQIWSLMVSTLEGAKTEGMVRSEVNSFSVSLLLWLNATSVLRFQNKVRNTPNSIWEMKEEFNPCHTDFEALYNLNAALLFHEIVTERGLDLLGPVVWPHAEIRRDPAPCVATNGNLHLAPFSEEAIAEHIFVDARL